MRVFSDVPPALPHSHARLSEFRSSSPAEFAIFTSLAEPMPPVARHRTIRREGERIQSVYLLVEGWALSSITLADGSRQILKFHLPGDVLGAPSVGLDTAAETLTALTPAQVRARRPALDLS